jgi:hypothetical protein
MVDGIGGEQRALRPVERRLQDLRARRLSRAVMSSSNCKAGALTRARMSACVRRSATQLSR